MQIHERFRFGWTAALIVAALLQAAACPVAAQGLPDEGAVRLVSRQDINGFATGAVQVFTEGRWGAVCSDRFDDRDAAVACRQLGFMSGTAAGGDPFSTRLLSGTGPEIAEVVDVPFALENLGCSGSEAHLLDCPPQAAPAPGVRGGCTPFADNYAFVACGTPSGPEEGSLRLAGGAAAPGGGAQFGRLEVFSLGGWGTVCGVEDNDYSGRPGTSFSAGALQVACRQLGFTDAFLQPLPDRFGRFFNSPLMRVPILLAGADCTGSEDRLTSCSGVTLENVSAQCSQDLNLLCFNGADPDMDGSLRLVGGETGPAYEYGRLEIFLRGFWSNICSTDVFTPDSAAVACKALGYDGGAALEFPVPFEFGQLNQVLLNESLPVALAEVDCDGGEASLLECGSDDAAILSCGLEGREAPDNTVLACINTVAECDSEPAAQQGSVRLIGGVGSPCDPMYTGIVEIFNSGRWGAVCGAIPEDTIAADVVCRQLGFPHGAPVDGNVARDDDSRGGILEESEVVSDTIWLFGVECRGPESTLTECLGDGEGFSDGTSTCRRRLHVACRQFAVDAALEQPEPAAAEGDVRLVGEREVANWALGHLEVFVGGAWRQVCAASFDNREADIACRQLGYGAGTVGPVFGGSNTGSDGDAVPDAGVTLPGCTGTEATLLECGAGSQFEPFFTGQQSDFGCREPGLTLACVVSEVAGQEGAIRLVEGEAGDDAAFGVPQIFHAGAWGTFCDGDDFRFDYVEGSQYAGIGSFGDESAVLLCSALGFTDGFFRRGDDVADALSLPPPWLGKAVCDADDMIISQCSRATFGDTAACGVVMELFCSNAPARMLDGEARLVGGQADPGGAWEYGRLEFRDRGFFVGLQDLSFGEVLGRRGAQVACRQLGYPAGAEVIIGATSALPGPAGVTDGVSSILCQGTEERLRDCEVFNVNAGSFCTAEDSCNAALVCASPSGCPAPEITPADGDVRLIPFAGTASPTAPCDPVHFGGVEIFNRGRWGALCGGSALDARVVCRQLGFPFGWMYEVGEPVGEPYDYNTFGPYDALPSEFGWASDVVCTGTEARLDACLFAESSDNTLAGLPAGGVLSSCFQTLGVVCSQFDLVDAMLQQPGPDPTTNPVPPPPPPPATPPMPAASLPGPAPPPEPDATPPAPPPAAGGRPRRPPRGPAGRTRRGRRSPPPATPPRTSRPQRTPQRMRRSNTSP